MAFMPAPVGRSTSAAAAPSLSSTALISALALAVAAAIGVALAYDVAIGIGLLIAVCFVPVVLLNLPLGIALWVPCMLLGAIPGVSLAGQAGAAVIAVAWFGRVAGRSRVRESVDANRGVLLLAAALCAWLALSLVWAESPAAGGDDLLVWGSAALVFLIIVTSDLEARHIGWIATAYVAGVVVSVGLGLVANLDPATGLTAITEQEGRLQGGAGDPNYLAASIVPAAALAAGLLPGARDRRLRVFLLLAIALLVIGLVASESRGGFVGAIVAVVTAFVVAKDARGHLVALLAIGAGVMGLWFAATPGALDRITNTADSGNGRGSFWRVAGQISADYPVLGVGLDNYRVYAPRYVRTPGELEFVELVAERPHVVHNVYLQALAELGLIGLLLLIAFLVTCLRASARAASRFERIQNRPMTALSRGLLVAVVGALTTSFFISNGSDPQLWILLALGPALLAAAIVQQLSSPAA